jgi:hypothetical protein
MGRKTKYNAYQNLTHQRLISGGSVVLRCEVYISNPSVIPDNLEVSFFT